MINVRTVFMGSPDFALTVLKSLLNQVNLVGVVTQPDRPAGRGKALKPPPVKVFAEAVGIPCIQPERLRRPESFTELEKMQPELIVVAAYGQILRQNVLDLPKYGCINVHASLLPRWRGAAPIQAAIIHGDPQTGVTIMKMDAGVDTGPIYSQRAVDILSADNSISLAERLAQTGGNLLLDCLPGILDGSLPPKPQVESGSTYAPIIKKEDGLLDFSMPAADLVRRVRAYNPWPGAFFLFHDQQMKVLQAESNPDHTLPQGQRGMLKGYPAVGTGTDTFVLLEVQPPGKKPMSGKVFLNGARNWATIPVRID